MRRLFILFMLCLLPVQITWAAVADYCAHEQSGGEQHFAHHDDEHGLHHTAPSSNDASDTGGEPSLYSIGYDHCHLSVFIGLLGESTLTAAIAPIHPVLHTESPPFSSQILDRPERPKWHPLA